VWAHVRRTSGRPLHAGGRPLPLGDDEQRLFVTERGKDGATRVRRVAAPVPLEGDAPVPLSEAFVRGYLGGLPKNF
jgi:hypothetical protein